MRAASRAFSKPRQCVDRPRSQGIAREWVSGSNRARPDVTAQDLAPLGCCRPEPRVASTLERVELGPWHTLQGDQGCSSAPLILSIAALSDGATPDTAFATDSATPTTNPLYAGISSGAFCCNVWRAACRAVSV